MGGEGGAPSNLVKAPLLTLATPRQRGCRMHVAHSSNDDNTRGSRVRKAIAPGSLRRGGRG